MAALVEHPAMAADVAMVVVAAATLRAVAGTTRAAVVDTSAAAVVAIPEVAAVGTPAAVVVIPAVIARNWQSGKQQVVVNEVKVRGEKGVLAARPCSF